MLKTADFLGAAEGFMALAGDTFANKKDELKFKNDAVNCMAIAHGEDFMGNKHKINEKAAEMFGKQELNQYNAVKTSMDNKANRIHAIQRLRASYGIK